MPRKYSLFLDTSVYLSGLNSLSGASGLIIALFKLGKIELYLAPEVLDEADEVINRKMRKLHIAHHSLLLYKPKLTKRLTLVEVRNAYRLVPTEDAPILAAAVKSDCDFLVTLDKDFYRRVKEIKVIAVMAPGEFIDLSRET